MLACLHTGASLKYRCYKIGCEWKADYDARITFDFNFALLEFCKDEEICPLKL